MRRSVRIFLFLLAGAVTLNPATPLVAQSADKLEAAPSPPAAQIPPPVFRATSRLVLLDVVVTDHRGNFIPGLKVSDFTILEDKRPQQISAFASHSPSATPAPSFSSVQLLPHQYTNFTSFKHESDRPVTVVLMDILNTSGLDQAYARNQMIEFLKYLPPGRPVALFALTSKLRMIQGFSGNSDTLVAAARGFKGPNSLMLSPEGQLQQDENGATALENVAAPSYTGPLIPSMAAPPIGQAIRDAVKAQDSFQKVQRMGMTLNALNSLARALAGYPGRKNLIWLSAEFPITFTFGLNPYGSVNLETGREEPNNQVREVADDTPVGPATAALLAGARLAVYPIDVRGLSSLGTGIDISAQTAYLGTMDMQNEVASSRERQTLALWDAHDAMSDIARETGGRAFYGTNDLKDAMTRSVQQGSNYYTIAYAPTNRNWNNQYRKIEVKALAPNAELTYRRGYYAIAEQPLGPERAADTMAPAMQPAVPDFTGLILKVQVLPPDADHSAIRIDYSVDAHDISFSDSDHRARASIFFASAAWDKDLKLAGHVVEKMEAAFRPDVYQEILRDGLTHHQELILKPGTYTLRVGVLDRTSHKIGSLGIPITIPPK
jgi:VWFA-related protein